jgi:hypothetical protein
MLSLKTYDSIDEVRGILPANSRQVSKPRAGPAEDDFERGNIYEAPDMGMGIANDLGVDVFFLLFLLSVLTNSPQTITKNLESGNPPAKDRRRYGIRMKSCASHTSFQGTRASSPCFCWISPHRERL